MVTSLAEFVQKVRPDTTVLFFGAGSSTPSKAPTVRQIVEHLSAKFSIPETDLSLAEMAGYIENKTKDRRALINQVKSLFAKCRPTGGLLNLPLYPWKSIYTTNYDTLIEASYAKKEFDLTVYKSNFDFSSSPRGMATKLYKLHGSIDEDTSSGDNSRIILTSSDYKNSSEYRQYLFNALRYDIAESNLIIIGYSLSDPEIREIVSQCTTLNAQSLSAGRIALFMYERDEFRASLHEANGLEVVFAGIDDFFSEMARKPPGPLFSPKESENDLEKYPALVPVTLDVSHQIEAGEPSLSRMFNGWPADYPDIDKKLTFERSTAHNVANYVTTERGICALLLGASGVGKTTAARQAIISLKKNGYLCWEHKGDYTLPESWVDLARSLSKEGKKAVLFIDDAHAHIRQLNTLIDHITAEGVSSLSLILTSNYSNWRPRHKTPAFFKCSRTFQMSRLDDGEIDRLLNLVDANTSISKLLETSFAGFSRFERRRRLVDRCEADMFVCLRNIFASESFDNIILREFSDLSEENQSIYRLVAALETSGIRVHRQLVIRLLNINMTKINIVLENLTDIITEYDHDRKRHIYAWKGRHPVITSIITRHKFSEIKDFIKLLDQVLDNISPTYELEIRSIVELCSVEAGISRITDKNVQNRLLAKMTSIAPGERVPRHRLIRNLIDLGKFDEALTEIRIFEKDFKRSDGPVSRYKIKLLIARALQAAGIMDEDRIAILRQAQAQAESSLHRYAFHTGVLAAYCDVGYQIMRLGGGPTCFDAALVKLREAETRSGDPDLTQMISRYDRARGGLAGAMVQFEEPIIAELE